MILVLVTWRIQDIASEEFVTLKTGRSGGVKGGSNLKVTEF